MPHDLARDAELELQLVMTTPLGYCMFSGHQYGFGSQV